MGWLVGRGNCVREAEPYLKMFDLAFYSQLARAPICVSL